MFFAEGLRVCEKLRFITKEWPHYGLARAVNTYGQDRTEVGVFLVELVMKEKKGPLDAEQLKMVRALLADASSVAVQVDTET